MRRYLVADLSPRWTETGVSFECPEANGGCGGRHAIPRDRWAVSADLATLTITPSIRCSGACRMHIFVTLGRIEFCEDSEAGPDWSKA